jgi:hypothetical protein
MKPAAFRYHAPKTIDEAVAALAEFGPQESGADHGIPAR